MKRFFASLLLVLLTFAYLYPGSAAMLVGSNSEVMSDDTDVSTLPFIYENLYRTFREHPLRFFYGAVYVDRFDPDQGAAVWVGLGERWLMLALHPFVAPEQLSTALVFVYLLLDALAMFALCMALKWNEWSAYALALAWTFSFYALARAQVHTGFDALYHLPLIFLSLILIARRTRLVQLWLPALLLVLAITSPHYYVVTAAFLSPLFLGFFFLQPEVRGQKLRAFGRLVLCALPVVFILGMSFAFPVPSDVKGKLESVRPETGAVPAGMKFHPYMTYYGARPIDYLTGPIWPGSFDPNPWRAKLDKKVLLEVSADGRNGNTHERTNGVRWLILLLAFSGVVCVIFLSARRELKAQDRSGARMIIYFLLLALAGFWLSLAPPMLHPAWSPAYWLSLLVSQIRVPSRAGMYVSFSCLMIVGYWLNSTMAPRILRKMILLPALFPLMIIAEFPPISRVQMAQMRPQFELLSQAHGTCGAGLYFPFVNYNDGSLDFYYFQQRLRGSDCQVLNAMTRPQHLNWLAARFPPTGNYVNQLPGDTASRVELMRLARCVPLSWIVFDPHVAQAWRESVCQELGWTLAPDLSCIAPDHSLPLQRFPDDCG